MNVFLAMIVAVNLGTGVVVSADGLILTAKHVLRPTNSVLLGGKRIDAKIIAVRRNLKAQLQ